MGVRYCGTDVQACETMRTWLDRWRVVSLGLRGALFACVAFFAVDLKVKYSMPLYVWEARCPLDGSPAARWLIVQTLIVLL